MKKYMVGILAVSVASCFGEDVEKSDCEKARASYEGLSVAAGVNYQNTKTDIKLNDNLGILGAAEGYVNANNLKIYDKRAGKVGGSVALGYNKFVGPVLAGLEATVDISGDKTRTQYYKGYRDTSVKTSGTVPTIAARIGGYVPAIDTLAYLRLGVAFPRTQSSNTFYRELVKNKKAAFVLGAGVQKRVFDSLNLRVEGDYRFRTKKSKSDLIAYNPDGSGPIVDAGGNNVFGSIENKSSGYVVRVMAVYNFNI